MTARIAGGNGAAGNPEGIDMDEDIICVGADAWLEKSARANMVNVVRADGKCLSFGWVGIIGDVRKTLSESGAAKTIASFKRIAEGHCGSTYAPLYKAQYASAVIAAGAPIAPGAWIK